LYYTSYNGVKYLYSGKCSFNLKRKQVLIQILLWLYHKLTTEVILVFGKVFSLNKHNDILKFDFYSQIERLSTSEEDK